MGAVCQQSNGAHLCLYAIAVMVTVLNIMLLVFS